MQSKQFFFFFFIKSFIEVCLINLAFLSSLTFLYSTDTIQIAELTETNWLYTVSAIVEEMTNFSGSFC